MSEAAASIELELPRERALAACRAAIVSIDWELTEDGSDQLRGRQDPGRLCCTSAPVAVEIVLTNTGERTMVALHGKVPGFGPVAAATCAPRYRCSSRRSGGRPGRLPQALSDSQPAAR
jgi:hypothetical protein